MPQIRLYGLDNVIRRLQKGLEKAGIDLPARYAEAVEQLSAAVVKDARSALAKPNWELSKAMTAHSTKLYQNGRIVFKVVEVVGSAANPPEKNTPAAFVLGPVERSCAGENSVSPTPISEPRGKNSSKRPTSPMRRN